MSRLSLATRLFCAGMSLMAATIAESDDGVLFRDRIAPILEARCVRCHGGQSKKGGLSLVNMEAARLGGDGGASIVPGEPDKSLLLEKISGEKPEMPRGGKPLSAEEVEWIRLWIQRGADWPASITLKEPRADGPWWSLRPLTRPAVPALQSSWIRTPIDAFLLDAMRAKGLSPRPEADRRSLIRRLTFNLHGLPPTPPEIDAFLADTSPDAYEKLVDRLLASPRYGERWARHWLDLARYGDTHGYDKDKRRDHAWPYRDYVVRAFNNDMPYGRFIREQIAGDILYPGEPDGVIATGFVGAGPWDFVGHVELREGTVDKEKTRLIDRDDMLATTMSTFVSMTVHCARCHDHKFDPIPQKDYFRLQAVYAGVERGDRPYPSVELAAKRRAILAQCDANAARTRKLKLRIESEAGRDLERFDRLIAGWKKELAATRPADANPISPTNGYHSSIHPRPEGEAWVRVDLGRSVPIQEIRLVPARPTDFADTPGFGFPSRYRVQVSEDANFSRSQTVLETNRPVPSGLEDEPVILRPPGLSARFVRVAADRLWKRSGDYVFALAELEVISNGLNVALHADVQALDSIEGGRWGAHALVDGFDSRSPRPAASDAVRHRYDLIASIQKATSDAEACLPPGAIAERIEIEADRSRIEKELAETPEGEPVYAIRPRAPRDIRLLKRGEVDQPGELVSPGALSCVAGLDGDFSGIDPANEGQRRAALAEWIANSNNMLTWRSVANRIWQYHFGQGLVDTPSDFGRNGSRPSHPELLDWLAVEFRDGGQSWKALHRTIVTSAAYRQTSTQDEVAAKMDGDNRLLWRMNRRRLEAESIRDSILSVAGTLDLRMGGPGYEPFRFKDDHSPTYDHEDIARMNDPSTLRRTIYRFAVRSVPDPFVECLDGADPNAPTPVRNATITALQALTLRNDAFILAQSRAFARRLEAASDNPKRRIDEAFRLALGRSPSDAETERLVDFAGRRGWVETCRLLLNLNEFLFVD